MNNKVLFCATTIHHFKAFHLPYLKWFKEKGWEVHVAANGDIELPFVDKKYIIPIQRSPFRVKNIEAYYQLKTIVENNNYQIIHCHTPMGGVLARLVARNARQHGTKVIYTAHGFHFCKGAPLINWMVYYPIEKSLAHYTDCLITINEEDYNIAVKHQFKASSIEHVHGVGVNTEQFKPVEESRKCDLRIKFGYNPDDFLMFYAAEFNKNKNQQFLIRALALINEEVPHAKLLLAGDGPLKENCRKIAIRLGVEKMVNFLGYRNDIGSLLPVCDVVVASSLREGLPVNIMEAMSCGLPIIAIDNRGHRELVRNNENGWIIGRNDIKGMSHRIKMVAKNHDLKIKLGTKGRNIIESKYGINKVLDEKSSIYTKLMREMEELRWAVH